MSLSDSLTVGVAGLGTVGIGVIRLLQDNAKFIEKRAGRPVQVVAVTALSKSKDRGISLDGLDWVDNAVELAKRPDISVFVELIGGEEGTAKASVETAIQNGKHIVTANKALLAVHGHEIAIAAESAGVILRFEAAVAGGIPVVKSLAESLTGDRIRQIFGVMNGTCNYILTKMESTGKSYEEIFSQAMDLGYLEADPNLDVGGIDASHKLALLASIAYGSRVDFSGVSVEGIQQISITDIELAREMGYRVKLLCIARLSEQGLEQSTKPCLVPAESPIGQIENATNIVVLEGESSGPIILQGAGAGQGPTATAVLGDIIDIARGRKISTFGQSASSLKSLPRSQGAAHSAYYVRLLLVDQPGVLAKIASAFGDEGVSINRMRQYGRNDDSATVLIVTHETCRKQLNLSLDTIRKSGLSFREPVAIRIEHV